MEDDSNESLSQGGNWANFLKAGRTTAGGDVQCSADENLVHMLLEKATCQLRPRFRTPSSTITKDIQTKLTASICGIVR